ncbi:MAG: hypothetical protein V4793_41500 [Paraburkholderia tropica]
MLDHASLGRIVVVAGESSCEAVRRVPSAFQKGAAAECQSLTLAVVLRKSCYVYSATALTRDTISGGDTVKMRKDEASVAQLITRLMSDGSCWTIAALRSRLGASRTVIEKALGNLLRRGDVLDSASRTGPRARVFRGYSPGMKERGPRVRSAVSVARDPGTEIINAMVRSGSGK